MRNRALIIAAIAATALCPLGAFAQAAPAGAAGKVGIINIQEAIVNCAEGKKALTDLQAKYKPVQNQINQLQQEVSALQDQIQRQSATLSTDEQLRLSRQLSEKQTSLQRKEEDAQNDFKYDREDLVNRIGQKMVGVIDQYAKGHGYSLVFDVSSGPQVYYAADGTNITGEIVKAYDAKYPAESASAAPAKPETAKPKATAAGQK